MTNEEKLENLRQQYLETNFQINAILKENDLTINETYKLSQEEYIKWKSLQQKALFINDEMMDMLKSRKTES